MKIDSILVCGFPHVGFYKNVGEIMRYTTAYSIINNDCYIGLYARLRHGHITEKFIEDVYTAGKMPSKSKRNVFIHNVIDSIVILTYIKDIYKTKPMLCEKFINKLKEKYVIDSNFIAYFQPADRKHKFEAELHKIFKKVIKSLNGGIFKLASIIRMIKNNKSRLDKLHTNKLQQYYSFYY